MGAPVRVSAAYLASFVFVLLCLGPAFAHFFEMPHKLGLARDDYFVVQQIYRGWALFGIAIIGALLAMIALAVLMRPWRRAFGFALTALLCLVGAQVVFWFFTYPANVATDNWTTAPANWSELRARWEYSHAVGAVLTFAAAVALVLSLLAWARRPR